MRARHEWCDVPNPFNELRIGKKRKRRRVAEQSAAIQSLNYVWANKPVKPPSKESARVDQFRDIKAFFSQMLGTPPDAPCKDANGATITALVDAYLKLTKRDEPKVAPGAGVQSFEDAIFREPWSCYVIRNSATGVSYVGSAVNGFLSRYREGRWWELTHNERLKKDVTTFGLVAFRVQIYVCADELDMQRQEAALITANRLYTYNVRSEPG